MKIPIAIVDDNTQNRNFLVDQIKFSKEISVIFTAKNGDDFLIQMKNLPKDLHPAVVLMDIEMPEMNGMEAVKYGHQIYPDLKFLMLTGFDDDEKIFEAIRNGASGYLLKDEKTSTIVEHINQLVNLGGAPMSPSIARKALHLLSTLTVGQPSAVKNEIPGILSKRERE